MYTSVKISVDGMSVRLMNFFLQQTLLSSTLIFFYNSGKSKDMVTGQFIFPIQRLLVRIQRNSFEFSPALKMLIKKASTRLLKSFFLRGGVMALKSAFRRLMSASLPPSSIGVGSSIIRNDPHFQENPKHRKKRKISSQRKRFCELKFYILFYFKYSAE